MSYHWVFAYVYCFTDSQHENENTLLVLQIMITAINLVRDNFIFKRNSVYVYVNAYTQVHVTKPLFSGKIKQVLKGKN